MSRSDVSKNTLIDEFVKVYKPFSKAISTSRKISAVDDEFTEFVAELLGKLLGKSVWLSKASDSLEKSSAKDLHLVVGEPFLLDEFMKLGYERVERVWNEGEFSVLGDIVLIWGFSMNNLVRVSLFNNSIESIDIVDINTRKKFKSVDSKILVDSSSQIIVGNDDISSSIHIQLTDSIESGDSVNLGIERIVGSDSFLTPKTLLEIVKNYRSRGYRILYLTGKPERYEDGFEEDYSKYIDGVYVEDMSKLNIHRGFSCSVGKLLLLTDFEVLGEVDLSALSSKNASIDPSSVDILKKIIPGDYVVHKDHGIGKYFGIHQDSNGFYMEIRYAGKDKLFIPLTASEKLTKFVGAGRSQPTLTGLNSGTWRRISQKAREKAQEIAKELLQLYALRATQRITPVMESIDSLDSLNDFVSEFEFEDTDDQILATKHIVDDFSKKTPMDRLLVGDVGYGKTEIAMRAMFAVVNAGFQVALLCPTTILVEQHVKTLRERFGKYPVNISGISRFLTSSQKEETLEDLKSGVIDIVVGTHALLADDVTFKNLALLVVDEEQKFGVKQKERIKSRRLNCNVLSLTATPIPRTLNMALLGIRDISVLATPPIGRKEVINSFGKFNWDTVKKAVSFELDRGGQVYFLHNRVNTIDYVYDMLCKMFPQAKVGIAHGQMNVQDLSKSMKDFSSQKIDILVCTTIIENGLDIPSVNTLIVDDVNILGLSQMYQIRGRVGRSSKQAYAYFLFDSLKGDAKLRLDALKSSQELGSGFLLSNKDLEIRGAGDILGKNQSGAINSVGYGLYSEMLNEAVTRLKNMGK